MIGIDCCIEGCQVTTRACRRGTCIRGFMTFTAGYIYMRSCQWKFGFIMIKIRRGPRGLAMTGFAGCWKIRCLMIWICRCIIICKMASNTSLRCSAIIVPFVTGCTIIRYSGRYVLLLLYNTYCVVQILLVPSLLLSYGSRHNPLIYLMSCDWD